MDFLIFEAEVEVGEEVGLALRVGDVEDGDAVLLLGALEELDEVRLGVFVHGGERFVEEENAGLGGEGAGEGDALFFTTGEALREAVEEVGDAHFRGETVDEGRDGVRVGFLEAGGKADLPGDGEGGEERAVLGDKADAASAGRGVGDIAVIDPDASALRQAESAEDLDERGLSRAGAAHEHRVGAAGDFEADVLEGKSAGFPADVFEADHEGGGGGKAALGSEPGIPVFGDEAVVVKMRVSAVDAVDFGELAGAEGFVLVEAPEAFEQALAAKDFMEAGDAAAEAVGGVEEGGVAVGDINTEAEEVGGGIGEAAALMQRDGFFSPDRPVTEEPARDAELNGATVGSGEAEGREKVSDDGVIVSGVERDVVTAGLGDRTNDVEGLVAVEGSDLDGDDVFDFNEATPEGIRQRATADAGLQVEADDGEHLGDGAAVVDEVVLAGGAERSEAEEACVVAEAVQKGGFLNSLRRGAADAADADDGLGMAVHFLGGKSEDRFEEADAGVADGELSGVHTDREATGASGEVVAGEGALTALVEAARGGEGEGVSRDGEPRLEGAAEVERAGGGGGFRIGHPGLRSEWVC